MSRIISLFTFLVIFFWGAFAFAYDVPPKPDTPVYDGAKVLSPKEEATLSKTLTDFHDKNGASVVVAIIPSLDGNTIEDVANEIFNKWGIGDKKKNDGVLLLIVKDKAIDAGYGATKCGCMRIEVGKYLEGDLPDTLVYNILKTEVLKEVVQGHFFTASVNGTNGIIAVLGGTSEGKYTSSEVGIWDQIPFFWQVVIIIILLILIAFISANSNSSGSYYSGGGSSWGGGSSSGGSFGGFGGGSSGGGGASL